ncbi:MAG TPA: hypothetical protein VK179_20110 [Bacteroidales bacterium]|nr:hypothetical protein [Bacteroidales bacterium]
MKKLLRAGLFLLIITVLGVSCKSGKTTNTEGLDSISLGEVKPLVHQIDTMKEGLPIFYNMYLSVEMSSLFKTSGAVFKQDILNSPDKLSNYVTSSKKALNLGVYAVDLSYAKVSEQLETAGRYFNAMQKMAEEMGIPSDYFKNTAQRFDKNIDNKDSLIAIANEVYMASDNYLRENERYAASAQIILGGWVEAIHIAANVATSTKDLDVIERLADQKQSLTNVINMLNDYSSDVDINKNLQKLKELQPVFDSFVVEMDGNFNATSPAGKKEIQTYLQKVDQISKQINLIRAEIIS